MELRVVTWAVFKTPVGSRLVRGLNYPSWLGDYPRTRNPVLNHLAIRPGCGANHTQPSRTSRCAEPWRSERGPCGSRGWGKPWGWGGGWCQSKGGKQGNTEGGDVHKRGFPNSWMVSNAKSEIAWMICSYPHFREPPDKGKFQEFCARYVPLSTYESVEYIYMYMYMYIYMCMYKQFKEQDACFLIYVYVYTSFETHKWVYVYKYYKLTYVYIYIHTMYMY
jgi:hypothetical protein